MYVTLTATHTQKKDIDKHGGTRITQSIAVIRVANTALVRLQPLDGNQIANPHCQALSSVILRACDQSNCYDGSDSKIT